MSNRSTTVEPATSSSETVFAVRPDGSGVKLSWRALAAVIGGAFFIGGAWWTLNDHGRRIDALSTTVTADHEILLRLDKYIRPEARRPGASD